MAHDNATLACSKADRDRIMRLIAAHLLATGEQLTIKQMLTLLIDQYRA